MRRLGEESVREFRQAMQLYGSSDKFTKFVERLKRVDNITTWAFESSQEMYSILALVPLKVDWNDFVAGEEFILYALYEPRWYGQRICGYLIRPDNLVMVDTRIDLENLVDT